LVHTTFDKNRLEEELRTDFLAATDMADYLVTKGVPFREAHRITGEVVQYCVDHKMYFGNLDLGTLKEFSLKFEEDIFDSILPQTSIEQKRSAGSTNPHEVKKQIIHWTRTLSKRRV
jgi:argininosuccinate lyase